MQNKEYTNIPYKSTLYINAVGEESINVVESILGELYLVPPKTSEFNYKGIKGIKYSYKIKDPITMEMIRNKFRAILLEKYANVSLMLYQNSYNLFLFDQFKF